MRTLILTIHIIVCVAIIVFVMLQPSEGAGSMFGGGNTGTIFGGAGPVPFLAKLTAWAGALFFATSLILTTLDNQNKGSLVDGLETPPAAAAAATAPTETSAPTALSDVTGVNEAAPSTTTQ